MRQSEENEGTIFQGMEEVLDVGIRSSSARESYICISLKSVTAGTAHGSTFKRDIFTLPENMWSSDWKAENGRFLKMSL